MNMTLLSVEKIILAKPRGFCAGVERAVQAVKESLRVFGAPVYVKHEIVHNKTVVAELAASGAVTVEDIQEVPEGAVVVFSAHGSPPEHYALARERGCTIIDATCPFVTKVHLEMHRFLRAGYHVVYIGHKGHVEGIGVCREAAEYGVEIPVIDSLAGIEALAFDVHEASANDEKSLIKKPIAYLTQTTLSVDETEKLISALREKYPDLIDPPASDICYATTNRQEAVRVLAKRCLLDNPEGRAVVLVLGSKHSSNSARLAEMARSAGAEAYLIDNASEVQSEWLSSMTTVGVTAGASAPEYLVTELVEYLTQDGSGVEELELVPEDLHFAEPVELTQARRERDVRR